MLPLQPVEPAALLRSPEGWLGRLRQREEEVQVPAPGSPGFPPRRQSLPSVLTERLEEAIPEGPGVDPLDEGAVDQAGHQVGHVSGLDRFPGRDPLGRLEAESTGEHRDSFEDPALFLAQEVVAPVHGRPEAPLLRKAGAAAPGEQP